jgi:hypothetical protein
MHGLYYIMRMLEVLHEFIKFVLNRDTFCFDFMGTMKMCCAYIPICL